MAPPNTEDSKLTYRGVSSENDESIQNFERDYIPLKLNIKEIRAVIPSHCFQRNTLRSFSYVLRDLLAIAVLAYAASYIDTYLPTPLRYIAWPLYWFFAGAFGTGLWVLAHECGHRSFSPNKYINYTVGFILHSALLVPFHSWRITHSKHHKHTSDMEKDEVFLPKTRSQVGLPPKDEDPETEYHSIWEDAPITSLLLLIGQHLAGYPLYLALNSSGRVYKSDTLVNHFNPLAPMFSKDQYFNVILSDLGLIATFSAIGYFSYTFSFLAVVKFYLIPYLVVNHWLVMITFLQHTDPKVPHYRKGQWDFVRGAAATVDRHYGFLDSIFHKISSTHVAHHYFSEMPFYHAEEATKHLEKLLGSYYLKDDTPIFKALWNNFRTCRFVENEGDVVFYKR